MSCQPILFFGSGMSQRYFNAPNWSGLLTYLTKLNPRSKDIAYYRQVHGDNFPEIGTKLCVDYTEWAWAEGKENFSPDLFSGDNEADIFLKTQVCKHLIETTPNSIDNISDEILREEIDALISIRPHSLITTNYDSFLELLFNDYSPIVGEEILSNKYSSIGEISQNTWLCNEPEIDCN